MADPMQMSEKQYACSLDFADPTTTELFEEGGGRAGKTHIIVSNILSRAYWASGSRHLIARYRRDHLYTTVWSQTFLPLLQKMYGRNYQYDKQYLIVKVPAWDGGVSEIYGAGLDSDDRVEKILGSEYATIFVNEGTQISYGTHQKVKTRLSQTCIMQNGSKLPRKMVIDCNPRNKHHWIYRYGILGIDPASGEALKESQRQKMKHRKWFIWDNPFIDRDVIEMYNNLTGVERQRMYEAQWVNQEGLVYPSFDGCVVDPFQIPKEWPVFAAIDFGFTNPFVYLWLAYDQSNETYYLFDEIYESQKIVEDHAKEIHRRQQEYGRPRWVVADHDAEDRATLSRHGIETEKANKDVSAGIQAVTGMLRSGPGTKLRIFRTCVHTIEEGATYSWEEGKSKEAPKKEMDHAMDALRYFAMKAVVPELQWGFTRAS